MSSFPSTSGLLSCSRSLSFAGEARIKLPSLCCLGFCRRSSPAAVMVSDSSSAISWCAASSSPLQPSLSVAHRAVRGESSARCSCSVSCGSGNTNGCRWYSVFTAFMMPRAFCFTASSCFLATAIAFSAARSFCISASSLALVASQASLRRFSERRKSSTCLCDCLVWRRASSNASSARRASHSCDCNSSLCRCRASSFSCPRRASFSLDCKSSLCRRRMSSFSCPRRASLSCSRSLSFCRRSASSCRCNSAASGLPEASPNAAVMASDSSSATNWCAASSSSSDSSFSGPRHVSLSCDRNSSF
ncbi:hypothetical protein ECC02_013308 [Trypanosoma cruzi]|uniref:Uncharacterized protein n=1 Tax=Trypanosoma cruzi TaxID=5693 RepID=A0A7J6XJQ0_TRYCR|nr:hypothetical protein ECC02_013308 [Trypanosoma cruzi]